MTALPECEQQNARLVDFAYGELQDAPRRALEQHLLGCARCQADLVALRATRNVMASLEPLQAPESGVESLLAYAAAQAEQPRASRRPAWQRWLFAAVPTAALAAIIGTVALRLDPRALAPSATRTEAALPAPLPEPAPVAAPPSAAAAADKAPVEPSFDREGERAVGGLSPEPQAAPPVLGAGRARAHHRVAPKVAPPNDGSALGGGLGRDGYLQKDRAAPAPVAAEKSKPSRAPALNLAPAAAPLPPPAAAPPPAPASASGAAPLVSQEAPRASAGRRDSRARAGPKAEKKSAALDDEEDAAPVSKAVADGGWAAAERLRAEGRHRAAAAAFRAIYRAEPHGPRASEALFRAASESQAAGLLAEAAGEFELYARAFPQSPHAPAATARARALRSKSASRMLDRAPATERAPAR